jgi:hypothetical protein
MCDVPSIAVFCSETIECFPGTASYYYYYYYYYYVNSMYLQTTYPQDALKTKRFKSRDGLKTSSKNNFNIQNLTILPKQNIFVFLLPPSSSAEVEERVHLHLYFPSVPSGQIIG